MQRSGFHPMVMRAPIVAHLADRSHCPRDRLCSVRDLRRSILVTGEVAIEPLLRSKRGVLS